MKNELKQMWWTHLPALAALVIFVVYLIGALPLPARAAVHFDNAGLPNGYGSPWLVAGLTLGLSLLFIGISAVIDALWVSQERRKVFNWFCILDEVVVGALCGVGIGYLLYLESGTGKFSFPWTIMLMLGGGGLLAALLLEYLRPFHREAMPSQVMGQTAAPEMLKRIRSGASFIFWDSQNPPWVTAITIVLPLVLFAGAALSYSSVPWVTGELAAIGLLMFLPYGGLRTLVTRRDISVRFGLFGLRVLRLDMADVIAVEAVEFSPLKDFGGYGIRINREMRAYYLSGNRGVKLTMRNGKKYLIGSDDASALAGIIGELSQSASA